MSRDRSGHGNPFYAREASAPGDEDGRRSGQQLGERQLAAAKQFLRSLVQAEVVRHQRSLGGKAERREHRLGVVAQRLQLTSQDAVVQLQVLGLTDAELAQELVVRGEPVQVLAGHPAEVAELDGLVEVVLAHDLDQVADERSEDLELRGVDGESLASAERCDNLLVRNSDGRRHGKTPNLS